MQAGASAIASGQPIVLPSWSQVRAVKDSLRYELLRIPSGQPIVLPTWSQVQAFKDALRYELLRIPSGQPIVLPSWSQLQAVKDSLRYKLSRILSGQPIVLPSWSQVQAVKVLSGQPIVLPSWSQVRAVKFSSGQPIVLPSWSQVRAVKDSLRYELLRMPSGQPIVLPSWSQDVHHEVELALKLGADLKPVQAAVSLDLTLRDVQGKLKKAQHPWTLAKSFPCSAPLGSYFDVAGHDLQNLELKLSVNGTVRQNSTTNLMIFKIPRLLDYVSSRFPVVPGDLILTGTPHGVSALKEGDEVVAQVLEPGGAVLSEGKWSVVKQ
eukprot:gene21659-28675_t